MEMINLQKNNWTLIIFINSTSNCDIFAAIFSKKIIRFVIDAKLLVSTNLHEKKISNQKIDRLLLFSDEIDI